MSPFQGSLLLPKLELSSSDQHASLRARSNVAASETPVPTILSKVTLHRLCPLSQTTFSVSPPNNVIYSFYIFTHLFVGFLVFFVFGLFPSLGCKLREDRDLMCSLLHPQCLGHASCTAGAQSMY